MQEICSCCLCYLNKRNQYPQGWTGYKVWIFDFTIFVSLSGKILGHWPRHKITTIYLYTEWISTKISGSGKPESGASLIPFQPPIGSSETTQSKHAANRLSILIFVIDKKKEEKTKLENFCITLSSLISIVKLNLSKRQFNYTTNAIAIHIYI